MTVDSYGRTYIKLPLGIRMRVSRSQGYFAVAFFTANKEMRWSTEGQPVREQERFSAFLRECGRQERIRRRGVSEVTVETPHERRTDVNRKRRGGPQDDGTNKVDE